MGLRPGASVARALAWVRASLCPDWRSALLSAVVMALLLAALLQVLDWGLVAAQFAPDAEACRQLQQRGACWGVIGEKHAQILFGRYPQEQMWRPTSATVLLLGLLLATTLRPRRPLLLAWITGALAVIILMGGGVLGLAPVASERWGGLPLTLLLALAGMAGALPLGILLALGRRSELPALAALCAAYIELVRGVPLVSMLFLASFLLPLWLPHGSDVGVLVRVLAGLVLFAAAYLAEIVRGGLQSVADAQRLAAQALGLGYWQTQRWVVLPQALRAVLPALMNSFIATVKETSVVTVVSIYELTGALSLALSGDPDWRPFFFEGYVFIAAIYWLICFSLSRCSLRLERRLTPQPAPESSRR